MSSIPETYSLSHMPRGVRVGAAVIAIIGTLGIAAASFVLSFSALTELVTDHSSAGDHSWMWAVALDGLIVVATIALVAMAGLSGRDRAYALTMLIAGVLLSTIFNVAHAVYGGFGVMGAIIAAVPPLMLAAITHLTVQLLRLALTTDRSPHNSSDDDRSMTDHTTELGEWDDHSWFDELHLTENRDTPVTAQISVGDQETVLEQPINDRIMNTERAAHIPLTEVIDAGTEENAHCAVDDHRSVGVERGERSRRSTLNAEVIAWINERYCEGREPTGVDIAQRFGCSEATGRRWKKRALSALRDYSLIAA